MDPVSSVDRGAGRAPDGTTVDGVPHDLRNRDDVEELVVAFYETAFRDP